MMVITPRERVLRIFAGKEVDRMACFSGMGNITTAGLEKLGLKFWEVHADSNKMASLAATSYQLFGYECAVVPFDVCLEAEALGSQMNSYEGIDDEILYPTIRGYAISGPEELHKLTIPPDLPARGRYPVVLEALAQLKKDVGSEIAIGAWLLGPFSLAGQLLPLRELLKLVYRKPAQVNSFLEFLVDSVIMMAQQYRQAGADYICIREMSACSNLLSPDTFRTIIKPHLVKIFKNIGSPSVLHMCGHTNFIIGDMNQCGADALSVEARNNIKESRNVLGPAPLLFGNIDSEPLLTSGNTEEVAETVLASMVAGVDSVWPSCDIWPGAQLANLSAMVETVKKYGSTHWARKASSR